MKGNKRMLRGLIAAMLVLTVLTGLSAGLFIDVHAAETEKAARSYEIAVVYDNSGSMYKDTDSWCQAKYAMEIFASMLDYDDGDKLRIFPMWEVTDGKSNATGSYAPIEITSSSAIDRISRMYTPNPGSTPYLPIIEAYEYLKTSSATDKWLIVLTDGAFNLEKRDRYGAQANVDVQDRLTKLASNEIKIQYLGFGDAPVLQSNESGGFYANNNKLDGSALRDELISVCNRIFQRAILPAGCLNGNTLTLDISMKSLIVFVQGDGAKIGSLVNAAGEEVNVTLDSGQRKYSEIASGGYALYDVAKVDTSLYGQVVTFSSCAAGEYTLNYSGVDPNTIQIFYEPDVDIQVTLLNNEGLTVDTSSGEITAGEYTLNYSIVDSVTQQSVMDSPLMGSDARLTAYMTPSGGDTVEIANGGTITLEPDDATELIVEGSYLTDYTISTRDDPSAFPLPLKVVPVQEDYQIEADVLQPQSWYTVKDSDAWEPVKVSVSIGGQPLSSEQMARTMLSITDSKELTYWIEQDPEGSAYYIHPGYDQDGSFTEPEYGWHKLSISSVYTDEYGRQATAEDTAGFEVQWYDAFWRWLIWIVVIAIVVLVIVFILTRKAWPKAIYLNIRGGLNDVESGEETNLASTLYNGTLPCTAKKVSMLCQRGGAGASIKIVEVNPGFDVVSFKIGNSPVYTRTSGGFVDTKGNPFKETFVRNRTRIVITRRNRPTIDGRISMNGK